MKFKKLLSFILLVSVIVGVFSVSAIESSANTIEDNLVFNLNQSGNLSVDGGGHAKAYYKFTLNSYTTLLIDYEGNYYKEAYIEIIKESDRHNYDIGREVNYCFYEKSDGNGDYQWLEKEVSLNKGSYYFIIDSYLWYDVLDYDLTVTPTVKGLKNLKATTTDSTAKLTWTGDKGAVGYQVQKNTSSGYKLVKTTSGTSYTAKNLTSATSHKFRVRGYTTVSGKKYYGSWKNITAITKPSKVSIKTPTTNKKHKITAKWGKIARASGYQVQFCKNKACSKVFLSKTVSGQSKVSYTASKFTKNKKYYIRIRAYKTINGKKYYGAWSSIKTIKCK